MKASCILIARLGFILCVMYSFLQLVMATEVIFERCDVYEVNTKYITNVTAYIRRTSRRSPYYLNAEGTTLVYAADNVTLHAVFYEFLHNEYRRSFVEFHMTLCDLVRKEPWVTLIGQTLVNKGYKCPSPPGVYKFYNISVSMSQFPYVWPFERVMLQGHAIMVPTQEVVVRGRFYFNLKREVPKGK